MSVLSFSPRELTPESPWLDNDSMVFRELSRNPIPRVSFSSRLLTLFTSSLDRSMSGFSRTHSYFLDWRSPPPLSSFLLFSAAFIIFVISLVFFGACFAPVHLGYVCVLRPHLDFMARIIFMCENG